MTSLVGFDVNIEERERTTDTFVVHERELAALILECNNRKIGIETMERMAIEKMIIVLLTARITKRRAGNVTKKVKDAVRKSENFLNLT